MNKKELRDAFDRLTPSEETLSRMETSLEKAMISAPKPKRKRALPAVLIAAALVGVLLYPSVKLFSKGMDTVSNQTAEDLMQSGSSSAAMEEAGSDSDTETPEESEKAQNGLTTESPMPSLADGNFGGYENEEAVFSVISYEKSENSEPVLTVQQLIETEDPANELKALAQRIFSEDPSLTVLCIVWEKEEEREEYLYDGASLEEVR